MQPCGYSFNYSHQLYMPGNWTSSVVSSFLVLCMITPSRQLKNISHISKWKIQSSMIYRVPNHSCSSSEYMGGQENGTIVRINALKHIIKLEVYRITCILNIFLLKSILFSSSPEREMFQAKTKIFILCCL